ncbi:hypothetical protein A2697_00090 [Candidatus Curtissbacteria bacterium RIFCSPHIGHO2_01_FULL_41_44]|uniref:Uncharacterized protein n=1 Tax=Candidatus Curtissbacteria bacterium RIFCSPLOWO2_01_FULL_42_50 TaxID=1797730 RepID=A0A1F5H793_9BACT|nr:MAG: hypothetical protein A3C33_01935 [Candidatus Curtissbacteria bacterium RIFCSPHIGHO2_02_FULL_42_58]OGD94399.1 MAG: hypothetical protein A2697_00090 [Candidatus Curtissbacteria bacterium RIFCSPHIGHO2_01_FULL_41_44]OGD97673.1 MAG: hypothetical protein A3E71_01015 [Candidatus Curtissbacteria bacterium RIFCSPHIGHO2_12_FULL_42_33]OGD99904.1 MAG: hypothetical protein A3B54_00090 [Candidatus Curtissbacteria bacterium RIFCSPLOWO2_01_FULL_42_50]OGE02763.1 MAG: hypothetical protein A3G16_03055 [Ca
MLLKELAPGGLRPLPATNLILPEGPVDPKDPVWKDSFSVYEHRQPSKETESHKSSIKKLAEPGHEFHEEFLAKSRLDEIRNHLKAIHAGHRPQDSKYWITAEQQDSLSQQVEDLRNIILTNGGKDFYDPEDNNLLSMQKSYGHLLIELHAEKILSHNGIYLEVYLEKDPPADSLQITFPDSNTFSIRSPKSDECPFSGTTDWQNIPVEQMTPMEFAQIAFTLKAVKGTFLN